MKPLQNWDKLKRGYTFGVPTFYSNFHLGLDLVVPTGTLVYMPFDGTVSKSVGKQGGVTATVHIPGYTIRFMHLATIRLQGSVPQGVAFAETDNTGVSTAPHCHIDISKGDTVDINNHDNFIDPETFNWKGDSMDVYSQPEFHEVGMSAFRTLRHWLGIDDEPGANADAKRLEDSHDHNEIGRIFNDYFTAPNVIAFLQQKYGSNPEVVAKLEQIKQIVEG